MRLEKGLMNKWWKKSNSTKKEKTLELQALDYDGNSQDVKLLAGMPVIARTNNIKYGIVNNQTFVIKEISQKDETIVLKDDDEQIQIPFDQFQHMFDVAYCITIYKSQGVSINEPYLIHDWDKLDSRLKYVALTRSTDI